MTMILDAGSVETARAIPHRRRRIRVLLAMLMIVVAGVGWRFALASRTSRLVVSGYSLSPIGEIRTGHQRADRVAFVADGSILATLAPRYNYLTLDRLEAGSSARAHRIAEVRLQGRPVSLATAADRVYVLQRPAGDARHLEPAWWDTILFDGSYAGERVRVGFDPDDMALSDDGAAAFVLLSGSAEGESNRPGPCLAVFDLTATNPPRLIAELPFDQQGDDPERLALSGSRAAVALRGSNQVAWIDLSDRGHPREVGRTTLPGGEEPVALRFDADQGRLLVSGGDSGHLWDLGEGPDSTPRALGDGLTAWSVCFDGSTWIGAVEGDSAVEIWTENQPQGRLRLGGWSAVRPLDVAWRSDAGGNGAGLAAIGDRSGGVHLIRVERVPSPH